MAWRIQSLLPPRYVVLLDKACPLICSADFLQSRSATGATMNRDTDSFRTLYDANHRRVRGLLARLVGPEDAEDLAQAVFAKAAKALPTFRGEAQTSTWLHRIAVNAASDWLHSRSTHEAKLTVSFPAASDEDMSAAITRSADVDSPPSPEQELTRQEMRVCIRGEIGKLPATLRAVFMLSALGGLTHAEIAQTLGISGGSAKVRLHRARYEFRKIIEARCDFYRNELSCKPTSPDCCAPSQRPGSSSAGP
jgi:RNA polymerase sigma-70 factor, ECF subfamily